MSAARLALLALLYALPARAFLIQTFDSPRGPVQLSWKRPEKGVGFSLDRAGSDDLPPSAAHQILRESFAVWEAVAGSRIHFVDQGLVDLDGPDGDDRTHLVIFDETGDWLDAPRSAGIIALTRINSSTLTGEILDADILFNGRDFHFSSSPQAGSVLLKDVAVHEIGHFLGLDHTPLDGPAQTRPTMNPYYGDDGPGTAATLEADDQAGASALYPTASFLAGEGKIVGAVVDQGGNPLFGAHLVAENLDTGERYSTLSGAYSGAADRGHYLLRGLSAGNYRVSLEPVQGQISEENFGGIFHDLAAGFPVEFFDNASRPEWAELIQVRAGQRVEGIDFTAGMLQPGYPFISPVALPTSTPDAQGPYPVRVQVQDGTRAWISYRTASSRPRDVAMKEIGAGVYAGSIPGQATGTRVSYQVQAVDEEGKTAVYPHRDHWLDFAVVRLSGAPLVFTAAREADAISVIDTGDERELARIPVGDEPIQVLLAPDGRKLYVSSLGAGEIAAIATSTFQVVGRIKVAAQPLDLAFSPDRKTLYVANSGASSLTAIDLASGTSRRLFLPQVREGPYGVAVTRNRTLYVTDLNNDRVLALDSAGKELARIPVPGQPRSLALSRDGRKLYVTSISNSRLTVVDAARNRVTRSIPLPVKGTFAVAASPDGRRLYLTAHQDSAVVILDAQNDTVIKTLRIGADARALSFSPTGDRVFITSAAASEIAVLSTTADALVDRYAAGQGLRGIAVVSAPLLEFTTAATASPPVGVALRPGFPNPFNASTQIAYFLGAEGPVELAVYDALGQRIRTLVGQPQQAGEHRVVWDGRDEGGRETASGVYMVVLHIPGHQAAQKVLLLR